ncbi:MAG: hypothetical protein J6P61_01360 [Erysipelotrichaceae bacterium]|nr:hypothetical protein [Erysipelotrichaceae bacterium]
MKYLYIFNYFSQFEESLAHGEFRAIFNEEYQRYYFTDIDYPYSRSVFIKERLTIWHEGQTIEELVEKLYQDNLYYEDFKILYYKNKITHVDYQESLRWCRRLSDPIDGSTDLVHPKVEFALTKIHDTFYFGLLEHNRDWHLHEDKPNSYSHSLPLRVARTAVNLGVGKESDLKIIDPCCGVGTVVLEGLSMGLNIVGSDINRYVAYQARGNLKYYGYDPERIWRQDIHDIKETYDLAIIDVPYGVFSAFDKEAQLDLIKATYKFAKKVVIISHDDYTKEIEAMGFTIINQCYYRKSNFMRYLTTVMR